MMASEELSGIKNVFEKLPKFQITTGFIRGIYYYALGSTTILPSLIQFVLIASTAAIFLMENRHTKS